MNDTPCIMRREPGRCKACFQKMAVGQTGMECFVYSLRYIAKLDLFYCLFRHCSMLPQSNFLSLLLEL